MRAALPATCFVALLAEILPAQVLRVPGQHTTIQAALNAATPGTVILVSPGTYKELVVWPKVDGIHLVALGAGTVIDAAGAGRPVTFAGGVTRQTLLEGFELTGGLLTTSRNNGAGILVDGSSSSCSPTIRGNHIHGNQSDGASWNYGGGVHVTGGQANPLFEGNLIENNELRNGSWNYGAGIYVASGSNATILGNRILANKNLSPSQTSGNRGHGGGIYVAGSALIASNWLLGNLCQTTGWNYGAGLAIASTGTVRVMNNTFVDNRSTSGTWHYGGALYASMSAGSLTFVGNIVVGNQAVGTPYAQGGGLYQAVSFGATLVLDYNDVWSNTGGDYSGFTAGANDISVDPVFVSSTDFRIMKTSPCVDAMPATWLPAEVVTDGDADPRRIDGNLDGLAGNGARLDIGADEHCEAILTTTGQPKLGGSLTFSVLAGPTSLFVFLFDVQTGGFFIEPYGYLLLSPGFLVLGGGITPGTLPWAIPNIPALAGLTTWHQALTLPVPPAGVGQTTGRVGLTMF